MKKRYFLGLIVGCTLLMLGCSNQEANKTEDSNSPTVTNGTNAGTNTDTSADNVTQGEAKTTGQTAVSEEKATAPETTSSKDTDAQSEEKNQTEEISMDEAKKIALKKANLTEKDGSWEKEKLDHENGRIVYELDFISGKTEYEFEIDAQDGKILEYKKESVNDKKR